MSHPKKTKVAADVLLWWVTGCEADYLSSIWMGDARTGREASLEDIDPDLEAVPGYVTRRLGTLQRSYSFQQFGMIFGPQHRKREIRAALRRSAEQSLRVLHLLGNCGCVVIDRDAVDIFARLPGKITELDLRPYFVAPAGSA